MDVKHFISQYKKAYSKIHQYYNIGGMPAIEAVDEIIETIIRSELLHLHKPLSLNVAIYVSYTPQQLRRNVHVLNAHNTF